MKRLIILLLFFSIHYQLSAEIENYYIEIKKEKIIVGQYQKPGRKKLVLKKYLLSDIDPIEIEQLLLNNDQEKIMYYFHSMWGSFAPYHMNSVKKLNELDGIDKTISIVWHTDHWFYKSSWKSALLQGEKIGGLINQLSSNPNKTNYVLCHSMGHRIFEGIIKDFPDTSIRFQTIIFAGADLDVDVFDHNLQVLPQISNQIIVYIHKKDRALQISKKKHKRDRLGLCSTEPFQLFSDIENLEIVDVTQTDGGRVSINNHTYFKRHAVVFNDISMLVSNQYNHRKKGLTPAAANYFILN